ncbi:MAG: hypothetical protein KDB82_06895 [Planctomycetes bacterium]|nr:hypothetical protein [Planctomycetota bacterium]
MSLALAACLVFVFLSGCATTVHQNVWFEEDGAVVRTEAPAASKLPAADPESLSSVHIGAVVHIEHGVEGVESMTLQVRDQPAEITPEPRDLDVAVRVDGEPGSWISRVQLYRSYRPASVPKGTASLMRFHFSDGIHDKVDEWTETNLTGDPNAPRVEADVYLEYYLVGRRYVPGEDWYYILQFRTRLVSEHPDWEVSDTSVIFEAPNGMKLTQPLFPNADEG